MPWPAHPGAVDGNLAGVGKPSEGGHEERGRKRRLVPLSQLLHADAGLIRALRVEGVERLTNTRTQQLPASRKHCRAACRGRQDDQSQVSLDAACVGLAPQPGRARTYRGPSMHWGARGCAKWS